MANECPNGRMLNTSKEHCLHATGTGTTHGWGGNDNMICCLCGHITGRRWSIQEQQLSGHGTYFKQKVKVYD